MKFDSLFDPLEFVKRYIWRVLIHSKQVQLQSQNLISKFLIPFQEWIKISEYLFHTNTSWSKSDLKLIQI